MGDKDPKERRGYREEWIARIKERILKNARKCQKNKEMVLENARKRRAVRDKKVRTKKRRYDANREKRKHLFKKSIREISRSYVAGIFDIGVSGLPEELYQLKKEQLLLFRELKNLNKLIKNIKEESK